MSKIIRLPGLIDIHVHLRDPGETHKEDFFTGTSAALAGGVTTVFDMPNNLKPIFTSEMLEEKLDVARKKAVCDFGLYFGSVGETSEFDKVSTKVIGLKVYLSQTTGKYVVGDQEILNQIFKNWPRKKVIVIHAEKEKVDLAISTARKFGNKVHITHVNTKETLEKIIEAKKSKMNLTCDVTPHHLFLTEEALVKMKGLAMVKPPLTKSKDQEYLWNNLDKIDCIASDHAPHTMEEKNAQNPPAGIPDIETMLPLLLTAVILNRITIDDIIRLTNTNPQRIFGFKQNDAYLDVDLEEKWIVENENLKTKCGWCPYDGWEMTGKVKSVYIRGIKAYENSQILVPPGFGRQVHLK